jgi:hypothetical protein
MPRAQQNPTFHLTFSASPLFVCEKTKNISFKFLDYIDPTPVLLKVFERLLLHTTIYLFSSGMERTGMLFNGSQNLFLNADEWPEYGLYLPLVPNEIRLLEIEGGDQPICRIRHSSLNEIPDYHALSYHWGAPVRSSALKPIELNGLRVLIRPNIHSFLCNLIYHFQKLTVWLDILCINQKDAQERNEQVSLMGNIFSSATGVYVWLGDPTSDTDYAFDFINCKSNIYFDTCILTQCFEQIMLRPYWTRMWVIQEFSLAKSISVMCGTKCASWDQLQKTLDSGLAGSHEDNRNHNSVLGHDRLKKFNAMRSFGFNKDKTLIELMMELSSARCTISHDKAYGLRNLATDGHKLAIHYEKSTADLFLRIMSLYPQKLDINGKSPYQPVSSKISSKSTIMDDSLTYVSNLWQFIKFSERELLEVLERRNKDDFFLRARKLGRVESVRHGQEIAKHRNDNLISLEQFTAQLEVRSAFYGVDFLLHESTNVEAGDVVFGFDLVLLRRFLFIFKDGGTRPIDMAISPAHAIPRLYWLHSHATSHSVQLLRRICISGMEICSKEVYKTENSEIVHFLHIDRLIFFFLWAFITKQSIGLISNIDCHSESIN